MSCGYELTQLSPGPEEYKSVKDTEVKEILEFIFKDGFTNGIEQVIKRERSGTWVVEGGFQNQVW